MWYAIIGLVLVAAVYLLCMEPHSQLFGRYPYRVHTDEKLVALTFDDGPNEPYTSELLDFLRAEKIAATFFVVGDCVKRHPETAKRIIRDGHVVGNHSLKHRFRTYLKPGAFKQEVIATQKIIHKETGINPALIRTPWLWRQPLTFNMFRKLSLQPVGGIFCHPKEVFGASAEQIAERAFHSVRPGIVMIFHDGKEGVGGDRSQTVKAVKLLVPQLKKAGYKFVTADKLLELKPYKTS